MNRVATRWQRALSGVALAVAIVASGLLECHPRRSATPAERRGAETYAKMCAVCHGPGGEGYKADEAPAIAGRAFLSSASDTFLRRAIADGRRGTTMSAWSRLRGGPLSSDDVEDMVLHLRRWSDRSRARLDERPISGDASRGAAIYERECVGCHGSRGVGGPNVFIGNRDFLANASNGFVRYAIAHGRPGTKMQSFAAKLGEAGIEDILALLRSWEAQLPTVTETQPPKPPPIPLGPVPLHPKGPEPVGFRAHPATTSADVIKAQLDRGARMAILDARAPSDYMNEHIAGSVSVPFYDAETYAKQLPKDAWLVCYCSCPHAESGMLAQTLASKGFPKVTILDEGLGFWRNKKYPTHTGTEP